MTNKSKYQNNYYPTTISILYFARRIRGNPIVVIILLPVLIYFLLLLIVCGIFKWDIITIINENPEDFLPAIIATLWLPLGLYLIYRNDVFYLPDLLELIKKKVEKMQRNYANTCLTL